MTERDLMEGLNHIDDDLIEEAAGAAPKVKRLRRFPLAAAAVIVLGIGVLTMRGQLLQPVGNSAEVAVETTTEAAEAAGAKTTAEAVTEMAAEADEAAAENAAEDGAEAVEEAAAEEAVPAYNADESERKTADAGEPAGEAAPAEAAAADLPAEAAAESVPAEDEQAAENHMLTAPVAAGTVGIPGDADFGGDYHACTGYEELYDSLYQEKDPIHYYLTEDGDVLELEDIDLYDTPLSAAEDGASPALTYGAAGEKEAVPSAAAGTGRTESEMAAEDIADAEAADAGAGAAGAEAAADNEFSKTNVMTEGVDESDIVKTDGRFIYRVKGSRIAITDIRQRVPGEEAVISLTGSDAMEPLEIYTDGGMLVVIGTRIEDPETFTTWEDVVNGKAGPAVYREQTEACVYDITDPLHPVKRGTMVQDGSYRTSRKVGNHLYLFTEEAVELPDLTRKEALTEEKLTDWIPCVNGKPVAADCIYMTENSRYGCLIASCDLAEPEQAVDAKFLFTDMAEIYVGGEAIYLYYENWWNSGSFGGATKILKLPYQDGEIRTGGAGHVRGSIQDSFAIHEKGGNLYVLTTDYSRSEVTNLLTVLDGSLSETGRLDGIAPGEMIYAARFIGNRAYFVTYRNTDPLFVADITDPAEPKLLGEVGITGFSEYLHVWDDTHLLGIGYETDPVSGEFLGVKLTMFDISNPADIRIENTRTLKGDRGSSAIDYQYKAILADPGRNLIGFVSCDENWIPCYYVFSYTEEGFHENLYLRSRETEENDPADRIEETSRGLYAGDTFYIVSTDGIGAFDMTDSWKRLEETGESKEAEETGETEETGKTEQ